MTRVPVRFVDDHGDPTDDYVDGIPVVGVNVFVGLPERISQQQLADAGKRMKRFDALIDTGSNKTMITAGMAVGLVPLGAVPTNNQIGPGSGYCYGALVQVDGLGKPHPIEVGLTHLSSGLVMLLGRDILSSYGLVYDTPKKEFYLESGGS